MKHLLLFCILLVNFHFAQAQDGECGTDAIHWKLLETDPDYARKTKEFDAQFNGSTLQRFSPQENGTYIIPTVIHVMHKGEAIGTGTNISDQEIRAALRRINQHYRKQLGGNGVDTQIEFVLAVRSLWGGCTNGINRVDMSAHADYMSSGVFYGSSGMPITALKNTSIWNATYYYNIWLVSEIDNSVNQILGFAGFPSASPTDGAVILANKFADPNAIVAEHELGHALNLYHTFEGDGLYGESCPPATGTDCGSGFGDCCSDTPHHRRGDGQCDYVQINPCNPNITDNSYVNNFMSYRGVECKDMFTQQQKNRMVATVTTVRHKYLPSSGNMNLVPPGPPVVDFQVNSGPFVCVGQTVQLFDLSSCTPNDYLINNSWPGITFNWSITDGTNIYTFDKQNIEFTVPQPGTYSVTLTVTNAMGTSSYTRQAVFSTPPTAPLSFCVPTSLVNQDDENNISNLKFNTIDNSTARSGPYSNFTCLFNTIVHRGSTYPLTLTASNWFVNENQNFQVYIDFNNNGSFQSNELVFQGVNPPQHIGTYTTDVLIPPNAVKNKLLTMRLVSDINGISAEELACTSPYFVGDVEDYGVYVKLSLGIENPESLQFSIVPNPTENTFTLYGDESVDTIEIFNMLGQRVLSVKPYAVNPITDISALEAGTYLVRAASENKASTLKIVKL